MNEQPAWLSTITGLADTAGNLYSSIKGTNTTQKVQAQAAASSAASKSMLPFVLLGVVALAVVAFFAFRKN